MAKATLLPSEADQGPVAHQVIPGVSAAELDVMQAAAARFLGSHNSSTATRGMQALREPADSQAAGQVSARRSTYERRGGIHWMIMRHHAD